MALMQNNNARYYVAEPEYDAVEINPSYNAPGISARAVRGQRAANGGDISQLGLSRLVLDRRLQLLLPTRSRAYFQPREFDLGMGNVVAARVTLRLSPDGSTLPHWTEAQIKAVQTELAPKEDLTEAEVETIILDKVREITGELRIYYQVMAGFINSSAEGNNALKGVLLAVVDDMAGADTRTVAAGTDKQEVGAIVAADVQDMEIEHLSIVAENIPADKRDVLKAMSAIMGIAYSNVSPKLAGAFEPFSTAIEMKRVQKVTEVDEAVVNDCISMRGIINDWAKDGQLANQMVVEVVRAEGLLPDYLNDLTDQDFTDEEITLLKNYTTGDAPTVATTAALLKVAAAVTVDGSDWIGTVNEGSDDAANEGQYAAVGDWETITIDEVDYLVALAKYALACPTTRVVKTESAPATSLSDFATTRMNTLNHKLFGSCKEVVPYTGMVWGALSLQKSVELFDATTSDISGQVQHGTAHISFMKSSHHASANRLAHTLCKIFEATDQKFEASELPQRLAFGTYFGTKPADQRAVALFMRRKYAINELSFAIGRRITPHGPGTVSMYLLNLVMDQMNNIQFFKIMGRENEFHQFKGIYTQYAKTSHLEAPYAKYFYDESKAESKEAKAAVAPMYAYASAIGVAMPSSTIGDSVSLRRESVAAANNSITAKLEVESFVRAYRNFLRKSVQDKLAANAGIRGTSMMIEDVTD